MKKSLLIKFVVMILAFAGTFSAAVAQVTTSTIYGTVKDADGPLPGATIVAVHKPTGTKYALATRSDGRYNLVNVQVGGPYEITFSSVGFESKKIENFYVNLGEEKQLNISLSSGSKDLDEVKVVGTRTGQNQGTGTETYLNQKKVNSIPNVGRTLTDYLKYTPSARVDNNGGISIAGQNNRFNSIYINGASANDQFGLAATGTNGGQANVSPISIDAIEAFQVNATPYDIRYSGFTGGVVNAITKSGTNNWKGGFSYFLKNQDLAGKTPTDDPSVAREKLADFSSTYYSFRLGGPIIKDKLFFHVNAEIQRDNRPQPLSSGYLGNSSLQDIDNLRSVLLSKYGYETGDYLSNPQKIERENIIAKLDWNINDKNKLTLSHSYTNAQRFSPSRSSNSSINFFNGGILYPNKTNASTLELKTTFSNKLTNSFLATYTNVNDDRDPIGANFPTVVINDGTGRINFGTEAFSAGNQLKQSTFNLINETKYYFGKNTLSFIVDGEYNKYYNLFVRNAYGAYTYSSLDDFINDRKPSQYQRSFSLLPGDIIGDGSSAAADFKTYRLGLAIQNKTDINDKLTITYGLRADLNAFPTDSFVDDYFNNTALPVLSKYYDLEGARSGQLPKTSVILSPRFGYTLKLSDDGTTKLRGGFGIFAGRLPGVWPGGIYTNSGVIVGEVFASGNAIPAGTTFRPDVNNQYDAAYFGSTASVPSGEVNLVSKDFKLPSIFKINTAIDTKLPGGINATFEALYSINYNQVDYQSVNIMPATLYSNGPGSRLIYNPTGSAPQKIDLNPNTAGIQNPYTNIFLMNNGGKKGYAYMLSAVLDKSFNNGLTLNASYTFGRSKANNDGTSSQNSSQWRYMEAINGRNNLRLSYSDFDLGHRVTAYVSYEAEWFKFGRSLVTLSYFGQSGNRFSYVNNRSIVNDYARNESNDLMFVPKSGYDLTFVSNTVGTGANAKTYTQDQQRAAFEQYISQNEYLNGKRGSFADRNGSRTPFTHQLDLKFEQGFFIKVAGKKHNLAFSVDMQNFTNLLNKDWGRVYFVNNDNFSPLQFDSFANPNTGDFTPRFKFNPALNESKPWNISDGGYTTSRWNAQIGLKYFFE